jgi:hypothetical protein
MECIDLPDPRRLASEQCEGSYILVEILLVLVDQTVSPPRSKTVPDARYFSSTGETLSVGRFQFGLLWGMICLCVLP